MQTTGKYVEMEREVVMFLSQVQNIRNNGENQCETARGNCALCKDRGKNVEGEKDRGETG